jgi:hypothetical protein
MSERAGKELIRHHLREAHEHLRGEEQLAEYVARLDIGECARILAASPTGLPALAALRDECRVERDEQRGFEEVIRTWTLHVLSGFEGG